MKISIIIVNYNTCKLLDSCLSSLKHLELEVDSEVLVIDNASQDNSVPMVKNKYPWVKIIPNDSNNGFAKANNQGIKSSAGKYVLLLNSDTVVLEGCLEKILSFMDNNPSAGISGCRILNSDRSLQLSCYHFPNIFSELMIFSKGIIKDFWDPFTYFKNMQYWKHDSIKQVDSLMGAFLCVRNEVFDEIGYLDENLFMYYEDIDFCRRLNKFSKYEVYYYPDSEIIHMGQGSSKQIMLKMKPCLNSFTSLRYYFRKHHGKLYEIAFLSVCKFLWLLEMILFKLLSWHPQFLKKYKLIATLSSQNKVELL